MIRSRKNPLLCLALLLGSVLGTCSLSPADDSTRSGLAVPAAVSKALLLHSEVSLPLVSTSASGHAPTTTDQPGPSSALPVPEGLEARVALWEMVYADYGRNHLIFFHKDHPEIVYFVTRDFKGAKERNENRLRNDLKLLHNLEMRRQNPETHLAGMKNGDRLIELYRKFNGVTGSDRFWQASRRDKVGILRGRRGELKTAHKKAGPYLAVMEEIFKENDLPPELTRMVFVESGFRREARSSKGALGVWQLMPDTARPYLAMTADLDERLDPIASTRVAARVLSSNYERLGNWPLAVTAYNSGVNGMTRAVRKTGTTSLAELLRRYDHGSFGFAVDNFYARLLGILRAEKKLGLVTPPPDRALLDHDLVPLPRPYQLSDLAQKLGMEPQLIVFYNQALGDNVLKGRRPIPQGYLLRAPEGSEYLVRSALGLPYLSQAQ